MNLHLPVNLGNRYSIVSVLVTVLSIDLQSAYAVL